MQIKILLLIRWHEKITHCTLISRLLHSLLILLNFCNVQQVNVDDTTASKLSKHAWWCQLIIDRSLEHSTNEWLQFVDFIALTGRSSSHWHHVIVQTQSWQSNAELLSQDCGVGEVRAEKNEKVNETQKLNSIQMREIFSYPSRIFSNISKNEVGGTVVLRSSG